MGKFIQDGTGVVISVADEKDDRFATGFKPFDGSESVEPKRGPGRPKKADSEPSED